MTLGPLFLAVGIKQCGEAENSGLIGDCDRKSPELVNSSFSQLTYPLSSMTIAS